MTKVEYLAKLDRYLRKLPKDDYQEAMDYLGNILTSLAQKMRRQ